MVRRTEVIHDRDGLKHIVCYSFVTWRPSLAVTNPGTSCAIVGGGYAGIATAIELRQLGFTGKVTLFDARPAHQKITQWHKLARGDEASKYEEPFTALARKFRFAFVQQQVDVRQLLSDPGKALGATFGSIVVAQGSHTPARPPNVITFDDLRDDESRQRELRTLKGRDIAVVGGGPTGVQFAFEFAERGNRVILYEARDRLLPSFDYSLGAIALQAASDAGIDVRCNTEFLYYENGIVTSKSGLNELTDRTDYALFVPGVRSTPSVVCDVYGRIEGLPHQNLYAAGDNSYFSGPGLNAKSAQAAVRKGQHVARTIVAALAGKAPTTYSYAELGYFVSLGPRNAVGYLLSQKTAFSGRGALFMKEAIERQYNLYLAGLPVYP
ncbi:MAG TPA: FAD-dependent oxidoreductase [Turneriella sp.]|nr:FAD-dependent oxidoreductase [Turneriella sp.]